MTDAIVVVVDSRVWLPPKAPRDFLRDLRARFTHSNPDYHKKKRMGFSTWGIKPQIRTFDTRDDPIHGKRVTLPRGGMAILREVAADHGIKLRYMDRRTSVPVEFEGFTVDPDRPELRLRLYQVQAVAAALSRQQGVIRAPTGSGKTVAALALIAEAGERAIVIVRDGNLLKQWLAFAVGCLGLSKKEIGIVRGGRRYRPGKRLTLALQQSLYSKGNRLEQLLDEEPFGLVIVDEVQTLAARTFQEVIDCFTSKYRIGFSADETRKDRKEFLIYDEIGPVIHEISREELEAEGVIHPVTVRVVETEFRADWYRNAEAGDRDFQKLLDEMIEDPARNELLLELVESVVGSGETPALVFTHRREHAASLADVELPSRDLGCGLLMGGAGADGVRFDEDRDRILAGELELAVGTFQAIGQGHNFPVIRAGICATPISSSNRQFFGQVRGRICRTSEGKSDATLYYLWDREVFPKQLRALRSWNGGNVEIRDGDRWIPVDSAR